MKWIGAVQAQDYYGSLWALGLRLQNSALPAIESAIANKEIIRTWPMRHTLHFVAPENIRWMLKYLTPRVIKSFSRRRNELEIDEAVLSKSRKIITKALQGGKQITRIDIYKLLERNNIVPANQRGIHILAQLSMEGLLCFGAREGKQFTFTLLDEWVSSFPMLSREEALAQLAKMYFISHGPATVQDFSWWTGLSLRDSKAAIQSIRENLEEYTIGSINYYNGLSGKKVAAPVSDIHLLPAFDEYLVSYKDRSAAVQSSTAKKSLASFTLLNPTLIIDGYVAGTWTRSITKDKVKVNIFRFRNYTKDEEQIIAERVKSYCKFMGKELQTINIK